MKVNYQVEFNKKALEILGRDNIKIFQKVVNQSIVESKEIGVDAVCEDIRLPKQYVRENMFIKKAFGNNLEATLYATHRPTTIRQGTYNPTFLRSGRSISASFRITNRKSGVVMKDWFQIKLKGSGHLAVAYHSKTEFYRPKLKSGKLGKPQGKVRVPYAPSVNQVFHDVVKQDQKYKFKPDVKEVFLKLLLEKMKP